MKIKRTLPSVGQYSPYKQQKIYRQTHLYLQPVQSTQTNSNHAINHQYQPHTKEGSPRKPIFQYPQRNQSSPIKLSAQKPAPQQREGLIKSQINLTHNESNLLQYRSKQSVDKKTRRQSIFKNSTKQAINVVQTQINIKQLSDQLKKGNVPENQNAIMSRIASLQNVLQQINTKISRRVDIQESSEKKKQIKSLSESSSQKKKEVQAYKEFVEKRENTLLKLQLEQMRRCEKIARQNETLYGKLVKNIEVNSSFRNSRVGNKISEFEDLQNYQRKSSLRLLQQSQNQTQITSPFLLQQNHGIIKINR